MMKKILFGIIIMASLVFLAGCTNYDSFAKCLTEKNITMYGRYDCAHCNEQKKGFGNSFVYVNYVECAAEDPDGNPELCKEKSIQGYPSWEIEGIIIAGRIPMGRLSEMTGCPLEE